MTILDQRPASTPAPFDEAKLHAFIGKAIDDWGAIGSGPLILIGDELGLYDAMAAHGAVTSSELASRLRPPSGMYANGCSTRPARRHRHVRTDDGSV